MWPGRYFAARYFAPRYFAKVGAAGGASAIAVISAFRRMMGMR